MTLIKAQQIDALYRKLNLDPQAKFDVKTTLNKGSLGNTLNTGEIFEGKSNVNASKMSKTTSYVYKSWQ